MTGRYAQTTSVAVEKTLAEITTTLTRYGATSVMSGTDDGRGLVMARVYDRFVRFTVPLPDKTDKQFTMHSRGKRTPDAALAAWEQACRASWRSLFLVVKATCEAVAAGIIAEHEAFLAYTVMPDGRTVGEHTAGAIADAYRTGVMPSSILAIGKGS